MCVSPNFIWRNLGPKWEKTPQPCKDCWRCRSNKVSDYVGRALCEASVSDSTVALTLTYRDRDDLAEKVITPRHFQAFIRALRDSHHLVRYLVAAEYGELKGRAHFHAILFFKGKAPEIPSKKRAWIKQWPHGHVWADWDADDKAFRYVCKYFVKSRYKGTQSWFSLSKKPHIGAAFFHDKALRDAALGVLPSSFEYLPPGGQRGRPYLMTGTARRDYVATLLNELRALGKPVRTEGIDPWVAQAFDKLFRWQHREQNRALYDPDLDFEAFQNEDAEKRAHFARVRKMTFDAEAETRLERDGILSLREFSKWRATEEAENAVRKNLGIQAVQPSRSPARPRTSAEKRSGWYLRQHGATQPDWPEEAG